MKDIIFISDFFFPSVFGGSEIYSEELIQRLTSLGYNITKINSSDFKPEIKENTFIIVSNNKLLHENNKKYLIDNDKQQYIIIDHDPQWSKDNNPALHKNLIIPEELIQNKEFYKHAAVVFVQSKMHAEIITNNLSLDNVINLGCNLWNENILNVLEKNISNPKIRKFGVMQSNNKNKGMQPSIDYCSRNKLQYDLIPPSDQNKFIDELSKTEALVFLPTWFETFSRVSIEARILNCKLITNKMIGCTSEDFFQLKGKELLDFVRKEQPNIINKFVDVIENNINNINFFAKKQLPKVSLITTYHNASDHIDGFMDMVKKQTYKNFELLMVDAASNDDSFAKSEGWMIQNKDFNIDIKCWHEKEKITTSAAFNKMVKESIGEYIAISLIDDRMNKEFLEIMCKTLYNNPEIDLVYGDHLVTKLPNETVDKNSSRGKLWEHSKNEFSKENMIKCLPSPMFMCRKSMWIKNNGFDETLLHSCDWDFFLKCIENGSAFKKVNKVVGLYYFNPSGLSSDFSNEEKTKRKHKEEKETFFKYGPKIFPNNFELYKSYFENLN